ncbi:MAG TPA: elongation factor G, partial [Fibrobacteres bacterium]|nr:elongation factor G [Fibrobacterota bacterium]
KLGRNAVLIQIPIGLEDKLEGVVDLVTMKAVYFEGPNGDKVRYEEIPENLVEKAKNNREELLDAASMFSDELAEAYLDGRETVEMINDAIRKGTISRELTPVFMGSAYKNKGIQSLLDAVVNYLPAPMDVQNFATNIDDEKEVELFSDINKPTVAIGFKLEDGQYGQLTYIRVYQGSIKKGDELTNTRSKKRFKVGRLIRMHSNNMEDIDYAPPGDIVALFGVDCASGDTFTQSGLNYTMSSMYVPEPVISLAISPKDKQSADAMSKALNRFSKEDPTFRTFVDTESKETIIRGMGELHLDIYIERMKREYKVELNVGMPQVAYREAITETVDFDYTHKKQSGGAGQYGRVAGIMEPIHEKDYEFIDEIKGGAIPREYISACDKGFRACLGRGAVIGFPIVGIKVTINDGNSHPVDSSDMAFQLAAIGAFRQAYSKAKPEILEPIMKVEVEGPCDFQGNVLSSINQRRGIIICTSEDNMFARVEAEVPLSEMFGYSTVLRSITQGKAQFTMEFAHYGKVPVAISEKLIKEFEQKAKVRN